MIRPFVQKIINGIRNAEPFNRAPEINGYTINIYKTCVGVEVCIVSEHYSFELFEFLEEEKEELLKAQKDYEKRLKESIENMTHPFFNINDLDSTRP